MVDHEAEGSHVRQLLVDIGDPFQRKDVDAFIKCFHRDCIALYPNTPLMRGVKPWSKFIEAAVRDNVARALIY